MFRSLFILFLLVPLIEIYFLIQVGEEIGAGWTVFLVVATFHFSKEVRQRQFFGQSAGKLGKWQVD